MGRRRPGPPIPVGRREVGVHVRRSSARQPGILAAALDGLGAKPGERIAVQLPNWNEFFLVYAACARLGGGDPRSRRCTGPRSGFIVEPTPAPSAVITCGEFRGFDHTAMAARSSRPAVHPVTCRSWCGPTRPRGALTLDSAGFRGRRHPARATARPTTRTLFSTAPAPSPGPRAACTPGTPARSCPSRPSRHGLTRDDVMFMPSPVTHALGLTLGVMAPTWPAPRWTCSTSSTGRARTHRDLPAARARRVRLRSSGCCWTLSIPVCMMCRGCGSGCLRAPRFRRRSWRKRQPGWPAAALSAPTDPAR